MAYFQSPDMTNRNNAAVSHVVVTLHGIRTYGSWQKRFEDIVRNAIRDRRGPIEDAPLFVHRHYGFFSLPAFATPLLRWFQARRFRRELEYLVDEFPGLRRIDVFCHSFGTYIAATAIAGRKHHRDLPPITNLVLAGTVLPTGFGWDELIGKKVVRLINDCGTRDTVIFLNRLLIPLLGAGGLLGFRAMERDSLVQRYFDLGHSGYFESAAGDNDADWFLKRFWMPIVLEKPGVPVEAHDARTPLTTTRGIRLFLINNATVFKLGVLAAAIVGAFSWIAGLYANAEMQRELAVARLAASEVDRVVSASTSIDRDTELLAAEALKRPLPDNEKQAFLRRNALRLAPAIESLRLSINHAAISEDGSTGAMAWDRSVALFDLAAGTKKPTLLLPTGPVLGMAFDRTASILAIATGEGFYVDRSSDGERLHQRPELVVSFAFGPIDGLLAYRPASGGVVVFNPKTSHTQTIRLPSDADAPLDQDDPDLNPLPVVLPGGSSYSGPAEVGFIDTTRLLAIEAQTLFEVDLATGSVKQSIDGSATGLIVARSGTYVAVRRPSTGQVDTGLGVYKVSQSSLDPILELPDGVTAFDFAPDGTRLFWSNLDGQITELALADGKPEVMCEFSELQEQVCEGGFCSTSQYPQGLSFAIAPDGKHGVLIADSFYPQLRLITFDVDANSCSAPAKTDIELVDAQFVDTNLAIVRNRDEGLMFIDTEINRVLTQNPLDVVHDIQASPAARRVLFGQGGVAKTMIYTVDGALDTLCRLPGAINPGTWERVFGGEDRKPTCPDIKR
jgi:hypothetical protein